MDKLNEVVGKNGLYIKLVALIVAFIGLFLDFAKVTASYFGFKYSATVKFLDGGDGKVVLVLIIVSLVLLLAEKYAKDVYEKIPKSIAPYGPMGLSAVALGITIYDAIDAKNDFKDLSSYSDFKLSFEIGFWIVLIGLVCAVAVMVFEKFFMNKAATPAPQPAAPVQPTTEAPVENNQQ